MLENVFSWSKSRDEQFRECQRKYYYDKYQSWGGWDKFSASDSRMAYILKNLKNRWAWKGETVHHVIETILKSARSGRPVPQAEAQTLLTETMRKDYRSSKSKKYMEEPKKSIGLFEHEYLKPVSDDTWKKIHDSSAECLTNFYNSTFYKELLAENPSNWLIIEDLEEYNFEGSKIYVKLDFARKNGNTIEIYDWKTGKNNPADASVQMGTYALYAMGKWRVPLNAIKCFLMNLSSHPAMPELQSLGQESLDKTKHFIKQSIEGMHTLLDDVKKNTPKPKAEFAYTTDPRSCDSCNFLKICDKTPVSLS